MNPRILKKLCKRVDKSVGILHPYLERIDYNDGDIPVIKVDRKHLERWGGKPNTHGYFAPKKNTIGYGAMTGYYEREWEDENAWSLFKSYVKSELTDWENWDEETHPQCSVAMNNPSDVFKYAARIGITT